MERINAINPPHLAWPNNIGLDKTTKEIENLHDKVGPNKEIVV